MSKPVTFFFSLLSPWVYLGGPRFHEICWEAGATVHYRPINLFRVFRETGGTLLKDLHPSRRAYRAVDRKRWSEVRGMPLSEAPRFHPADESLAARMLIALKTTRPDAEVWPLAQAVLKAVWVEDLNIADPATLEGLASRVALDGAALLQRAAAADVGELYDVYTDEALSAGVFGVPSFVVDGQLFFGQDHLDFVERALKD